MNSNLCTGLTTWNTTVNHCTFSHAQNTTVLQINVLVTNKGQSPFPSADYCQGQLHTPWSLSVLCCLLTTRIICIYLLYLPVYFALNKSNFLDLHFFVGTV